MKQNITIRDVARHAGVSHQTVSRVINNKGEISAATRQRVLDTMAELDYRPSRIAQSLTTRRTFSVGLLVPNIANPFYSEIVQGAQEIAEAQDYNIFLCNTLWEPDKELSLLNSLAAHEVDGIIINSSRIDDEALLEFARQHRPVVVSGRTITGTGISQVELDNESGAQMIAEYLAEKQHKAVGVLSGPKVASTMSNSLRLDPLIRKMGDYGLPPHEEWIVHTALNAAGGYQAALRLLKQHPELTAIVGHNDLMAIGAMRACHELGLRVPEDCAIVGYNDIELAAMVSPALTTVHINRRSLGEALMERLLAMIQRPEDDFPPLILPRGKLIRREVRVENRIISLRKTK